MRDLYKTIVELCKSKGKNITQMCEESGANRASLTDLKMGRKKTLSAQTLAKIAFYFGVTTDYLLGIVDEYGLSDDDWSTMGTLFKDTRVSLGFSRDLSVDGEVLTMDTLSAFEDEGAPITPTQLTTACGLIGIDPTVVFGLWADRLWGGKKTPTVIDDELMESLELLRSRPDVRTLLHASKDMTPEQVEQMARFMQSMKGVGNEKTD